MNQERQLVAYLREMQDLKMRHTVVFWSRNQIPADLRSARSRDPRVDSPFLRNHSPFQISNRDVLPWHAKVRVDWGGSRMIAVFDLRRDPQTFDMAQMLDDLGVAT
jgi:hypothetical protein